MNRCLNPNTVDVFTTDSMADTTDFRDLILQRIKAIESNAAQPDSNASVVELDQTRVGRLSRMDALQMQQMDMALDRRQKHELAALTKALERIEKGDYGQCDECGEPINPKRLEVDPTATMCIDCAAAMEAKDQP